MSWSERKAREVNHLLLRFRLELLHSGRMVASQERDICFTNLRAAESAVLIEHLCLLLRDFLSLEVSLLERFFVDARMHDGLPEDMLPSRQVNRRRARHQKIKAPAQGEGP